MLDKNGIETGSEYAELAAKQDNVDADLAASLSALYANHIAEKQKRFQAILDDTGYQAIVIASGDFKTQFLDDLAYPFKANPYFKEWLPLNRRRDAFLVVEAGVDMPTLLLDCAEDIWHTEPQSLPEGFDTSLKVVEYEKIDTVKKTISNIRGEVALLAERNHPEVASGHWNPKAIIDAVDFQRRSKTDYEHACLREANRLAAPAHFAAREAFLAGASEYEIAQAYLQACQCTENEMPYGIIAGVNENAAVLHHYELNKQRPSRPLSFLLDAGVDFHGYASDISRTYAIDAGSNFAAMIALLNTKQLELVAAGAIGKSPVELHELSLRAIAQILIDFKLVNLTIEAVLTAGILDAFYPHGLGHHLGVNVHDRGTHLATPQGEVYATCERYPKLRHKAPMVANQVYTVEPGIYFIPSLLQKLRDGKNSKRINWPAVEAFVPFGGIRIEDNIILHADGRLENMTRDALGQYP